MADGKGHLRILRDRKWEDYRSLKQYYRNHNIEEIIYTGNQTITAAFVEVHGSDQTFAVLSAEAQVYVKSEQHAAGLVDKKVYCDFLDSSGILNENVETQLEDGADTSVEVPLGFENVQDTVASVGGTGNREVTLTALAGTLDQYAGKYMVVYQGDQKGTSSLIVSNTAATPTVLTVSDDQNANLAADVISIQTDPYEDFFRLRRMWCQIESPANTYQAICDHDGSNLYGIVDDGRKHSAFSRYFVPAATTGQNTKYYLGYIKARYPVYNDPTDANEDGCEITVTYVPQHGESVGLVQTLPFSDFLDWQPCIELKPGTDVYIKVKKLTDTNKSEVHLELCILEVDRLSN